MLNFKTGGPLSINYQVAYLQMEIFQIKKQMCVTLSKMMYEMCNYLSVCMLPVETYCFQNTNLCILLNYNNNIFCYLFMMFESYTNIFILILFLYVTPGSQKNSSTTQTKQADCCNTTYSVFFIAYRPYRSTVQEGGFTFPEPWFAQSYYDCKPADSTIINQ